MTPIELTLFADYFQFYLQDEQALGDLSESSTEQATADLLALAPGTIGVGTRQEHARARGSRSRGLTALGRIRGLGPRRRVQH